MNRVSLACMVAGYALCVVGFALIYHPLAWLAAGSGLLYASLRSNK